MNCRQAEHHIFAERDGTLDALQQTALSDHVTACPNCRRMRDGFAAAVETWRTDVGQVRLPDADLEWQKLRHRMQRENRPVRRSVLNWFALPLGAAAALAVGLYVAKSPSDKLPAGQAAAVAAATSIPTASEPESTVVFVDDKSGWTFVWAADNDAAGHI